MEEKELDAVAEAVWHRLQDRLSAPAEAPVDKRAPAPEEKARKAVPDAETRYAIWLEASRKIRLAKGVDLRELAMRYPLIEDEIRRAVKFMTRSAKAQVPRQKEAQYAATDLESAIVQTLAYAVLASREVIQDDKPKVCPSDKKFSYPGSNCREKGEGQGDFECRGEGKSQKDFTCTGTDHYFHCENQGGKETFTCDASSKRKDTFECTRKFRCEWDDGGTFYCARDKEKHFDCKSKRKDEFACTPQGPENKFFCSPGEKGAGFQDRCVPERDYICQPPPQGVFECPKQPFAEE